MRADICEPGTVPRPLSSFVGRERELADVTALLAVHRLLTLTGPGGSGKTRLVIELAHRVGSQYPDGVHFVPLAPIREPALVPRSIAQSLGLQDSRGRPLVDHLADYLRDRTLLLVLDNFEQVTGARGAVADLLAAGTNIRVVVTSRARLRLTGEQEFAVPPLPVPSVDGAESLEACASTALFLARATALVPGFSADAQGSASIKRIVRRLDGLPLAIELAAARVKVLPLPSLLARLDYSLSLLVGGSRDLPDRQQTLRNTIAWSYDLLGADARRVLAILAAFRGGADLADVEAVCEADGSLVAAVVDGVQELVDDSLLRLAPASGQPRYVMLETVREYAAERLAELPDAERIRAAHARIFAGLAERLERPPIWPDNEFLARLDSEQDNLRAALDWLQDHDPGAALRMAAKLAAFWSIRGHFSEGRHRLRGLLAALIAPTPDRVAGLNGAGWLAFDQGAGEESFELLDESVQLARALGDRIGEGTALYHRGRTGHAGLAEGGRDVMAAIDVLTAAGDENGVTACLLFAGLAPQFSNDLNLAIARFAECARRSDELGLNTLRARAMQLLGIARLQAGDLAGGHAALRDGVPVVLDSGDRFGISVGLGGLTMLAASTKRPRLALRLVGVLDEFTEINQVAQPEPLRNLTTDMLVPIRTAAGAPAEILRAEGRRMPLEHAVAEALSDAPEQPWRTPTGTELTRREREVAKLVASGLTNREVAARLFLSVRTVDVHVGRILAKLDFRTRGQLTAWAHQRGLAPRN